MSYIDWDDFDDYEISKNIVHLDQYDMYYVNFKMKDGTSKTVRVFCDKGSIPEPYTKKHKEQEAWYEAFDSNLTEVIGMQLVGRDGLMNQQGRDDYIYRGNFSCGWNDIYYPIYDGKTRTKLDLFEDNLFRTQLQVQAIECQQASRRSNGVETREYTRYSSTTPAQKLNGKGKHYAISDVHGMYGSYDEAIKRMSPNDHLYIIGDAIDRGSEGIKILQDIIRRKNDTRNNPEITFLLGNHEWQFLHCLALMQHFDLTEQEVEALAMWRHFENGGVDKQTFRDCYFSSSISAAKKGVDKNDISWFYAWYLYNGGRKTLPDFLELDKKQQDNIVYFLSNSPLALSQEIEGKKYLFVHAMPPEREELLQCLMNGNEVNLDNIDQRTLNDDAHTMLEGREKKIGTYTYGLTKRHGFTTICGHEPTIGKIVKNPDKGFVRIDAACPSGWYGGKLALYCIEDGKTQYIDSQEREGTDR